MAELDVKVMETAPGIGGSKQTYFLILSYSL